MAVNIMETVRCSATLSLDVFAEELACHIYRYTYKSTEKLANSELMYYDAVKKSMVAIKEYCLAQSTIDIPDLSE